MVLHHHWLASGKFLDHLNTGSVGREFATGNLNLSGGIEDDLGYVEPFVIDGLKGLGVAHDLDGVGIVALQADGRGYTGNDDVGIAGLLRLRTVRDGEVEDGLSHFVTALVEVNLAPAALLCGVL